jgi:hypothetical protein
MKKYLEPAKEIDVAGEYDVIIVGGGPLDWQRLSPAVEME